MKMIICLYVMMSLLTFCVYGVDKWKARKGWWRIPEATLHLLELLFGWPGALIAQKCFRHKTVKKSYRLLFWLMVVINVGLVSLYYRYFN